MLVEFPHPYAAEIVDIGNCFGWITSYDVIDDWDEFSKVGQAVWYDKKVELRIANSVDVNIATATRLKEKISKEILNNSNYYIVNNGVDPSKMKQSARLPDYDNSKGILQIGYFGHLTDSWFDWELLRYLAEKHLDWTFHIIGYGEPDNLKIPENIILYGKKEPLELPKYAAFWDVAIIPFIDSELTLSVNPIKIYEYLQLRLPTVTTNMPEVKRFPYTEITTDRESFEKAILDSKKIIIDDKVIDDFIKDNTWEKRIESILEHIKNFNESDTYKAIFFGGDK